MPHEHVYGICENKCLIEVEPKVNTDAVKARVETLESYNLNNRTTILEGEMDSVEERTTTLESEMDNVQPRVNTLETKIASLVAPRFKYTVAPSSNYIWGNGLGAYQNDRGYAEFNVACVPIGSTLSGTFRVDAGSNITMTIQCWKNDGTFSTVSAGSNISIPSNTYKITVCVDSLTNSAGMPKIYGLIFKSVSMI